LNFSTSISRQWLLISSCRSHLWRRLGSLWSVSANVCAEDTKWVIWGIGLRQWVFSWDIFTLW